MSEDPGGHVEELAARVGPENATVAYSAPGGVPQAVAVFETWAGAAVEVTLRAPGGRWRPVGVCVRTGGQELRPEDALVDLPAVVAALLKRMGVSDAPPSAPVAPQAQRRGRAGYSDDFYKAVAMHYLRLCGAGVRQGLHEQIAQEMKVWLREPRPRPVPTVRSWVHEATRRGYLTGITSGRTGAVPGPRFYE